MSVQKFLKYLVLSTLFCSFALAESKPQAHGNMVGMIVVVINEEPYTLADLEFYLKNYGIPYEKSSLNDRESLRKLVKEMVSTKLLEKEAEKLNMKVEEEDVDAYIAEVKNQNGIDQQQFNGLLKEKGVSLEQYRNQIKFEITKARVLSQEVRKKVNIIDKDIDKYLEEHPTLKPEEDQIALEQIFIRYQDFPDQSSTELRKQMESIKQQVAKGKNFREAGGVFYRSLGFVNTDDLKDELRKAVSETELGQVSEVAETDTGLFILKPSSAFKEDGSANILTKEELENQLYQEKYGEVAEKYFSETLPARYNVEIKI